MRSPYRECYNRPVGRSGKRLGKETTCYACDEPAVSRDHAPPQIFFPEYKDLGAEFGDLRVNLKTVPSCAAHNNELSGDDMYLACFVVTHAGNNAISRRHFDTKIMRALDEDGQVAQAYADALYGVEDGKLVLRRHPKIDLERYERAIDKIARGLYYSLTKRKVRRRSRLIILSPDLVGPDPAVVQSQQYFDQQLRRHQWIPHLVGPRNVFCLDYYIELANPERFAFKMTFYEGFRVWVCNDGSA